MSSSTVIRTNYRSLNAHRNLAAVGSTQDKASRRLSSGKKINSAADDAAGLAISEKMKAQIRGLDMASKNAQDATSLVQTAEGSIGEIDNMVQRCRELAVQAGTDTNKSSDCAKLNTEVSDLLAEIDAMAGRTKFNEKSLNDTTTLTFQIGANNGETIDFTLQKIDKAGLSLTANTDISDTTKARAAISVFDGALDTIATYRAKLGALQNRLEYTDSNLQTSSENLSAANSRIEDADMASEMSKLTSANVLQQAATAMLAQANSSTQTVLQILQ